MLRDAIWYGMLSYMILYLMWCDVMYEYSNAFIRKLNVVTFLISTFNGGWIKPPLKFKNGGIMHPSFFVLTQWSTFVLIHGSSQVS